MTSLLLPASAQAQPQASIDSQVFEQLQTQEEITFWVLMKQKEIWRQPIRMSNWEARGRFVYERLNAVANESQARIRATLQGQKAEFTTYWIINAVLVKGDRSMIEQLAKFPEVERIALSQKFDLPPDQPAEPHNTVNGVEWNIDRIRASQMWNDFGVTGEGIVVANIDTGVEYTHEALVNQYRGNLGDGTFD